MARQNLPGLGGIIALNHRMHTDYRPKLHRALYPSLRKLIHDCWDNDPKKRPTFDEIIKRMGGTIIEEIIALDEPDCTTEDDNYEDDNKLATNIINRINRFDAIDAVAEATDRANTLEAENKKLKLLVSEYEDELEFKNL